MRLISLCPSNTELLHYLQLTDELVGVDDFSDWPEEIGHLPKLGPDLQIDMDKVATLNPDLVLASLSVPGMERNIEALQERKIPHIVLNPQSLQDIQDDLLKLGKLTNTNERARQVASSMRTMINSYSELAATITSVPQIYWEWWPKPVFTPGNINWLTEISVLAGATNIFSDKQVANYQTDWQEVKERNPDVICMIWVGVKEAKMKPKHIKKRPDWADVTAVQSDNILVLEENLFCRPSPRLLAGLQKIAHQLHPEVYPQAISTDPLLT
ncbi:cobalamin-binding protein [Sutcliffiella halmapala]|uniref:cobalamin-binding protein n=1 Tax=Sutcliffiella halmapala TaxID=79882 RepID=UPI0009949382|nr:cobalamin-binding protein [Sutcliffiella halmapala]